MINALREKHQTVADISKEKWVEFRVLETDSEVVRVLLMITKEEATGVNYQKLFYEAVMIPAVTDLPERSATSKNCSNLFASENPGAGSKFGINLADWEVVKNHLNVRLAAMLRLNLNIEAVYFYVCKHGLKAPHQGVLERFHKA